MDANANLKHPKTVINFINFIYRANKILKILLNNALPAIHN